jgi:hypothetical protein
MSELFTEIEINASPERVWQLLTDLDRFPEWNPFIQRISGTVVQGERLEVTLKPPDTRATTFKPTVIRVEPERELRWLGHVVMAGVFDGEHIFTIEPLEPDRVRFVQREEFKGLLAPLMLCMIGENTKRGFEAMNQALKEQAENLSGSGEE